MTNLVALQNGTELVNDYRIERVLGAGGFGITYLAGEIALGRHVTIKEYFPADFAARGNSGEAAPRSQYCANDYRWGLDRFISEAQALAKFNHPNIVRVYRYFRANNTGYMVLHFEEGQSLKAWLKSLGRAPRQAEIDAIISPLIDALELIHKADFLHRDIAPDNIIIRRNGTPVLIDFGSARGEIAAHSKTVSALVKPGYSPYEQYAETSRQQGPWTDIYALGATLYHAITGKRPPDSPSRMVKDDLVPARDAALAAYRPEFLRAIDHALTLSVEARPQSVADWRHELLSTQPEKRSWLTRSLTESLATAVPSGAPKASLATEALATVALPPAEAAALAKGSSGVLDFFGAIKRSLSTQPANTPPKAEPTPPAVNPALAIDTLPLQDSAPEVKAPPREREKKKANASKGARKAPQSKSEGRAKRKPARPHPIRAAGSRNWRPIVFKLLVGVGVASAAVALQNQLPKTPAPPSALVSQSGKTSATTTASAEVDQSAVTKPLGELRGHIGTVNAIAYASDGSTLASVGEDAKLMIWNTSTKALLRAIPTERGPATSLSLFGSRALTAHKDGTVVLWNWESGFQVGTFKRNEAEISAVTFTGSSDRFATSSQDWKVALWDTNNSQAPIQVIDAHENSAQALAYILSEEGPLLASGSADNAVKLWSLTTLDRLRTYQGHRDAISALAFAPRGDQLASASADGSIRLWSTSSNRSQRRLYGHRGRVGALAYSLTGDALASVAADGQLRIWDISRGRTARTIAGQIGGLSSVSFSPSGDVVAAAGDDGVVRLWQNPLYRPPTN